MDFIVDQLHAAHGVYPCTDSHPTGIEIRTTCMMLYTHYILISEYFTSQ